MSTELDKYLAMGYISEVVEKSPLLLNKFKEAMQSDESLKESAQKRLVELNDFVNSRGEKACFMSSVHRKFLEESLNG